MKDIVVLGKSYSFPEIKDQRFESLQDEIRSTRNRIQEGSSERRILGIWRRPPALDAEGRITLMEELVSRYDELVGSLKQKIGGCTATFGAVGEGVTEYFNRKVAELEAMEARRATLAAEAIAAGQPEVAAGLEVERERIRALAMNLTRASVLIIRKLRHALGALETLVDDEAAQRKVLDSLKGSVSILRKTHQFTRDLDSIERDIASMTRLALSFDTILRDNLGPLSLLIDEVTKVDSRVADSLIEIERLSAQLESRKDVSSLLGRFDDRIFEVLVRSRAKKDALEGIVAAMSDPMGDLGDIGFETELAGSGVLDFRALAVNMGELVRRGLRDLRGGTLPLEAPQAGRIIDVASRPAAPALVAPVMEAPAPAAPMLEAPPVEAEAAPVIVTEAPPEPERAQEAMAEPGPETAAEPSTATVPEPATVATPAPEPAPAVAAQPAPEAAAAAPEPATVAAPVPSWLESLGKGAAPRAPRGGTPYGAAISRADPTLIVFLLDRSGSMDEPYAGGMTKAGFLARTVDRTLLELAVRCNKADGTRDYFHIACMGYGDGRVSSAFAPPLDGGDHIPISRIAQSPLRLEEGPEGTTTPVWIEARSEGDTPMRAAFEAACRFVAGWCDEHPRSYPPTVINVSDGQSTDGDPSPAADILRQIHTDDGACLVYNLHVRSGGGAETVFPESASGLDEHGKLLFGMSSPFPPHLRDRAVPAGFRVGPESRFFAYGAGAELVARFFELGTRPTRLS